MNPIVGFSGGDKIKEWRSTVNIWISRSPSQNSISRCYSDKNTWRSTVFRNST
jgi:hypothetical protein